MKTVSRGLTAFTAAALTITAGGISATAQRTRTVSDEPASATQSTTTTTTAGQQPGGTVMTPRPPVAPQTVKAKYEGGILGYRKSDGTLNFDDANRRLVFRDKNSREMFSVPYDVVFAAWADTKSNRSAAGTVIASTVPYGLGLPALLMKNKTRYLTLQYRDKDTQAEGIATFKLQPKELLASVLYTFAEKAGLVQRGEAFIRRRDTTTQGTTSSQIQNPN